MSNNKNIKLPALPYSGTSGWSGTSTSKNRAKYLDSSGITAHNQLLTIKALHKRKGRGLTVHELRNILSSHHGSRSGILSALHRDGYIARLTETRGGCFVYVHPDYINNRPTSERARRINNFLFINFLKVLKVCLEKGQTTKALKIINQELSSFEKAKNKKNK